MGYRDVLVHVPLLGSEHQVELALTLAKRFDAHITGICILPDAAMLRSAVQNPLIRLNETEVADIIEREYKDAAAVEQRFSSVADEARVSHDWVTGEGDPADVLIHALVCTIWQSSSSAERALTCYGVLQHRSPCPDAPR